MLVLVYTCQNATLLEITSKYTLNTTRTWQMSNLIGVDQKRTIYFISDATEKL